MTIAADMIDTALRAAAESFQRTAHGYLGK